MRTRWLWPLALILLLLAAGCGEDGDLEVEEPNDDAAVDIDQPDVDDVADDDLVTIRMGWGIPVEEPKYVMMAFPEVAPNLGEVYEVDWQEFAGTAPGVQGLAAGTLDGATVGGQAVANGIAQGADIVITGGMIEEREICTTPYLVRADDDIVDPEDLEGRMRGTSTMGGSTYFIGRAYLEQEAGLEEEVDYDVVEVPFAQGEDALREGEIDIMEMASFFGIEALDSGDFETLFCVTDVLDPFVQLLQGFSGEFVEEHPDVVEAFMEDWVTVTNWVLDPDNRDQVIEATHQATDMPEELLDSFLLIEDLDYHRPENGSLSQEALQENWDFFHEIGEIPDLQVEDYINEEFLPPEQ